MIKNKEKTKERIYQAMIHLLKEKGFQAVGVNAIAREAGVNKALIYRYFGGMEGLMLKYAKEGKFWPHMTDENIQQLLAEHPGDSHTVIKKITISALRELREMRNTQEILRWELVDDSELSKVFMRYMNRQIKAMQDAFRNNVTVVNVQATGAIISSAIVYLVLLSRNRRFIYDIDLHSESGWSEIEHGFLFLLDALNEKVQREEENRILVQNQNSGND